MAEANEVEILPFGEKFSISSTKPVKTVELHMAKNEFEIFTTQFDTLKPFKILSDIKLVWKSTAPTVELNSYWLGVHKLNGSSFSIVKKNHQIADIAIPYEQMGEVVPPQSNVPDKTQYLFELYTSPHTKSGTYEGHLAFVADKKKVSIPIKLTIYDLVLPEKFELKTSFGFAPWPVLNKHYDGWNKNELSLYQLYESLALEHRVDLHKMYIKFPDLEASDPLKDAKVQAHGFLEKTRPLFSGESNKKKFALSTTDLPVPEEVKKLDHTQNKKAELFWKNLNRSVTDNKLEDKSFVYFVDEPTDADLPAIAENLKKIRAWSPKLKFLVTTSYNKLLDGLVDIWCVNLSFWDKPTEKSPQFYKNLQQTKNQQLWFYVSCNSHGCDNAENNKAPDLVIDRPAAFVRAFPLMALRYEAEGILYYDTVYGYQKNKPLSPWADQFYFTGYGEGNLFYPCTANLGGCKAPQTFSSLRLKILRDGLEDVQILKMIKKTNPAFDAQSALKKLLPQARNFSESLVDYADLKAKALQSIKNP